MWSPSSRFGTPVRPAGLPHLIRWNPPGTGAHWCADWCGPAAALAYPARVNDAALAAAIGGSLVGVAGVLFGWLNSRGERHNAVALARERHDHERQLARGERFFDARSAAYQHALKVLYVAQERIDRTYPIVGPRPEPPEAPSEEEWSDMFVKLAVFGSEKLMQAFEAYSDKSNEFYAYASTYAAIREQKGQLGDTVEQMNRCREEAREALLAIERRIREELAGL